MSSAPVGYAFAVPATAGIPAVSVVIPTLNEAANLRLLLPTLPAWIKEVVIVDGRSTDETVQVAQTFGGTLPLRIVMEARKGKGAALRAGFRAASGDIIVALDADCSMHPCEIPLLIAALTAGADFAKGSRFVQGGGSADMSAFRAFGNWSLTQVVKLLYGCAFTDLCYGYFAFWRRHLSVVDPSCDGFEVETFIKLQALKAKLRIAEVPSFETLRIHGASNLRSIPDGLRVLRTILRERWSHPRPTLDHAFDMWMRRSHTGILFERYAEDRSRLARGEDPANELPASIANQNSLGMADPQGSRLIVAATANTDRAGDLPPVASSAGPETAQVVV